MKNIRTILIKLFTIIAFAAPFLFITCMVQGFTNFGHVDVAEFISFNIKNCAKESLTNRVVFEMEPINDFEPFFKNNKQAVAILAHIKNDTVFMNWDTYNEDFSSSSNITNGISLYGMASRGALSKLPFELQLLSGDYDSQIFNTYDAISDASLPNEVYISKALSDTLFPGKDYSEIIGKDINNSKLEKPLNVKGVVGNKTILNNYNENEKFIVGSHLIFSVHFPKEKIILKLDDSFNTNYSIFKKLFYSTSWVPPFSEKAYIKLNFVKNEWLKSEAVSIYNNSLKIPNYLPVLFDFLYLPLGFVGYYYLSINIKKDIFKDFKFECLLVLLLLFLYWLAEMINTNKIWFGVHIVGSPVFSIIYFFLGIVFMIVGILIGNMLFRNKITKMIVSIDDFYKINI